MATQAIENPRSWSDFLIYDTQRFFCQGDTNGLAMKLVEDEDGWSIKVVVNGRSLWGCF